MDEQIQSKTREMALLFSAINNLQVYHCIAHSHLWGDEITLNYECAFRKRVYVQFYLDLVPLTRKSCI